MRTAFRHAFTMAATALAVVLFCAAAPTQAHASTDELKTVPLLMVVVEFDDGTGAPTLYDDELDWSATMFDGNESLASYYSAMSGGAFTYSPARESSAANNAGNHNAADKVDDGIVHITLPEAHQAWGMVNDDSSIAREFGKVVQRAVDASRSFVDYDAYDADDDGVLEADELVVCICVAGYDASALVDPGRTDIPLVWPHTGYLSTKQSSADANKAVMPSSYIALAERIWYDGQPLESAAQEPLGVLYHELGHSLGLPDLYPLNKNPEEGAWGAYSVGWLSLMDDGGWAQTFEPDGREVNAPTALDAWSRYVLGWEMPQIVTSSGDYVVRSQLSSSGYQSLLIPTSDPNEYFIVENRQPEGIDEALANEYASGGSQGGLVIWHVDKDTLRQFSMENTINNTTHQPAVMETYFEALPDGSGYAIAWEQTVPDTNEPFYDSASCVRNYGNAQMQVTLPLYNDDPNGESPSERANSDITLQFPTESAREMTVHVELQTTDPAKSSRRYPPDNAGVSAEGASAADVVCAALIHETGADVALVDTSEIKNGIAEGPMSWSDIYAVTTSDSNIATYTLTGNMLLEALEQAADDKSSVVFGGVACTIDEGASVGSRISEASIGNEEIKPDGKYTVAVTEQALDACPALGKANRQVEMLWGSPADALRSFVITPDWEETTARLASEKTYIEPPEPEEPTISPIISIVPIAVAVIVCALGAIVIALLFRRTAGR